MPVDRAVGKMARGCFLGGCGSGLKGGALMDSAAVYPITDSCCGSRHFSLVFISKLFTHQRPGEGRKGNGWKGERIERTGRVLCNLGYWSCYAVVGMSRTIGSGHRGRQKVCISKGISDCTKIRCPRMPAARSGKSFSNCVKSAQRVITHGLEPLMCCMHNNEPREQLTTSERDIHRSARFRFDIQPLTY
ncbi:hypothetical protein VTG60DRAFT_4669 [Thermothelomyces hinnuleus]